MIQIIQRHARGMIGVIRRADDDALHIFPGGDQRATVQDGGGSGSGDHHRQLRIFLQQGRGFVTLNQKSVNDSVLCHPGKVLRLFGIHDFRIGPSLRDLLRLGRTGDRAELFARQIRLGPELTMGGHHAGCAEQLGGQEGKKHRRDNQHFPSEDLLFRTGRFHIPFPPFPASGRFLFFRNHNIFTGQ